MSKLAEKIKEEITAITPPTVFFFIALHIVAFIRVLMLKQIGGTLDTTASVTLAALILGKAMVIADLLPFINRYSQTPLAWLPQREQPPCESHHKIPRYCEHSFYLRMQHVQEEGLNAYLDDILPPSKRQMPEIPPLSTALRSSVQGQPLRLGVYALQP